MHLMVRAIFLKTSEERLLTLQILHSLMMMRKENESIDLYFKGWKYYTSYGDGPKVETLSNSVEESRIVGTSLTHRGYFSVDLANIFNPTSTRSPARP